MFLNGEGRDVKGEILRTKEFLFFIFFSVVLGIFY